MSVVCAGDVLVLQCFLSGLLQQPHVSLGGQGGDQVRMHQDEFSLSWRPEKDDVSDTRP